MTTAQLEHLRRIDAHCESKLAASEYIPHYSESAEAGWRATRAAIAEILAAHEARFESWCLVCQELNQDPGKLEDYPLPPWSEDILAAFPLELIQKP